MTRILFLALALLLVAGCGAAAPAQPTAAPIATPTTPPKPTIAPATAVPATATPAPTKPAVVDARSSGLGATKADWERGFGQPERKVDPMQIYSDGRFWVTFTDDRVAHLERIWGDRDAKSKPFVMGALGSLLPADKQLVGEVKSRGGTPGELYRSEALAKVFPPDRFINGEPGQFVVLFRTLPNGMITSAVVGLGNNP